MRALLKRIIEILDGTPAAQPPDRRKGQSLVEMVFITPILLIMFIGLIEIGWFAQNYLNLVEAAKVGARRGPFLAGQFSPQQWPNSASLPPTAAFGFTLNPGDTGYDDDPRIIYRGMVGGTQTCDNILPSEYGFFNTIACAVVDSMDPLRLRLGNSKDDIVISAFSVQYVRVGSNPSDDINPGGRGSATPYATGNQVVVVGRWPSNANECVEWGERDPFDWIENGAVDWEWVAIDPDPTIPPIHLNYELGIWDDTTSQYIGWNDGGTERAVGWSWTGQRQIEDVNRNRINCWGSQFTLDRVQDLLNLPTFIPPGSTDEQERKSYFPSLGLVIVEVYWEHSLLLENFPLLSAQWSPVYQVMGGDDPNSTADVIYAWAAFPVPSAEPRLVFKP